MKLALIYENIDPTRGGAETYVADLCRGLIDRGCSVDLYARSRRAEAIPREARWIRVDAIDRPRSLRVWSFARNVEAKLREHTYDCTIGFINTWSHDVIVPQGGVTRASVACNARRFPPGIRRGLYRAGKALNPKYWICRAIEAEQYAPERGARVVAVSAMTRDHIERYQGVERSRIDVVHNAIDLARIDVADPAAVRSRFRRLHGLGENDLTALFTARNFELKGLRPLLKALALRLRRDPAARPITLLVCGGDRIAPFQKLIAQLNLQSMIKATGYVPEARDAFWASDFFVQPTYYDPCSLVVLEALACGLPVITTSQNGASELIVGGREGFVLPHPDAHALAADALDRLSDDALRAEMAANARKLGREWTFDRHVDRLLEIFAEVAAAKRGSTRSRSVFQVDRARQAHVESSPAAIT
jgi:UDP-glucose:(heptosyl)LPS alpha-1,3-glucosyltransferase